MKWSSLTMTALILSLSLCQCARYVVPIDATLQQPAVTIQVDEAFLPTVARLEKYLRARGHLENETRFPNFQNKVLFFQPWLRDSSLRYYMLELDDRIRHLSEWKGEWIVQPLSPSKSQIRMIVLEVIFVGPPDNARPRPEVNHIDRTSILSREWFETDPDNLRAALELRRFWIENYPLASLPRGLTEINVPDLKGPPTSPLAFEQRRWNPMSRPKTF